MKIPKPIYLELKAVAEKLPTYKETMYAKRKVIGNDINLKGNTTDMAYIDRNKEYIGTKNVGRDIDTARHLKRLKKAYKKNGDEGVMEYVRQFSKIQRKRFTFWQFIKYHLFGIKPFDFVERP